MAGEQSNCQPRRVIQAMEKPIRQSAMIISIDVLSSLTLYQELGIGDEDQAEHRTVSGRLRPTLEQAKIEEAKYAMQGTEFR